MAAIHPDIRAYPCSEFIARARLLDPSTRGDRELLAGPIRRFVATHYTASYPRILAWYDSKVCGQFDGGSRMVHVIESHDGVILGESIAKASFKPYAKLCSFFLAPAMRGQGFGALLMTRTLWELERRSGAKPIVVTVPADRVIEANDGLSFGEFLQTFGFSRIAICPNRYRDGIDEWVYLR